MTYFMGEIANFAKNDRNNNSSLTNLGAISGGLTGLAAGSALVDKRLGKRYKVQSYEPGKLIKPLEFKHDYIKRLKNRLPGKVKAKLAGQILLAGAGGALAGGALYNYIGKRNNERSGFLK